MTNVDAPCFVCKPDNELVGKRCAKHVGVEGPRRLDPADLTRLLYDWPNHGVYRPRDGECPTCKQRKLAAKQGRWWCYGCGRWDESS